MGTTEHSVDLMWTKSAHFLGVKQYEVYRDGKKLPRQKKQALKILGYMLRQRINTQ